MDKASYKCNQISLKGQFFCGLILVEENDNFIMVNPRLCRGTPRV